MADYGFADKATALMTGLATLGAGAEQSMSVKGTEGWGDSLPIVQRLGSQGYMNAGQIASDYNYMQQALPGYRTQYEIQGMTDGQKVGSILSSTVTGAATGSAFGGYGAAFGAGLGFIGGLLPVIAGGQNAKERQVTDSGLVADATLRGNSSIGYAAENYLDWLNRDKESNSLARGGRIRRKRGIHEYAERIYKNKSAHDSTHSAGIVREKVDGGVRIKIKR